MSRGGGRGTKYLSLNKLILRVGGAGRGRGAPRGGARGGLGAKSGSKVVVEPHRHAGVFIARGKEDMLCTKNMVPGESVYGEKRISVDVRFDCVSDSF
jgi:hypothetical protein